MQNPSPDLWHGTTILTVRKGGVVAIGGDGQVSIGQTIVRRSLDIAADICVYTNRNVTIETLKA